MILKNKKANEMAKKLLAKMMPAEKVAQMIQLAYSDRSEKWAKLGVGSLINAYDEDVQRLQKTAIEQSRLKIPILFSIDCIHGHALNAASTIFPSQLAMAQSFDTESLIECGMVSKKEALTDGIRFLLSPVLDIARDIRWCRIDETFGEDPYLVGELGAAMIKGYNTQIDDENPSVCCPKHFIAHSDSIGGRDSVEVSISQRNVKQFFMPPYEKAVRAGCDSIMSGQHIHDGRPMCTNGELINDMLKKDNEFEGFVITDNQSSQNPFDYGTAKDKKESFYQAVMAGNDILMFCSKECDFYELGIELYKERKEFRKRVDDAVERILTVKYKIGLFENPYYSLSKENLCSDEHFNICCEITRKSVTMLKNSENILPLCKEKIKKISVIGPTADNRYSQYGDWTYLNMPFSKNKHEDLTGKCITYLKGISELASEYGISVVYSKGCGVLDEETDDINSALEISKDADIIVLCVGDLNSQNGESHDRSNLKLSGKQNELANKIFSLNIPVVTILSNGKPLCINEISEKSNAILEFFNGGLVAGKIAAEILFGITNPSGKLPISFPRSEGQLPVYYNYLAGWHGGKYIDIEKEPLYNFGFGLSFTTFEYSDLEFEGVDKRIAKFSVKVKNTGRFDGTEIVQLYVTFKNATIMQPIKNLKGFKRIPLKSGEEKTVFFDLSFDELEIVKQNLKKEFDGGEFEISIGGDSKEEHLLKIQIEL